MKNKIKKIVSILKHVKQNPYLINKFLNEVKHFGIKNAIKKARSKTSFDSQSITTREQVCTFKKSNRQYDIKVSVIIPTYNRSALLPSLLDSWREVDKTTKYKYEIIFSDDGSNDGSVEILEQAKDLPIKVLKNDHGGAAKARNNAILHAKGEKLYIIGDDIFPNPQIINQHYEKLKELPICNAVLGEVVWHKDLKINTLMKHITELGCEQFSFNAFPPNGYIDFRHFYTSNISIDREFLMSEQIIFDESFNKYGFEDIELGYRLFKKGMKIYYLKEAVGEHYHPYSSVESFCKRQENAGAMALVFKKLHKEEIEWVVQVEHISVEWKKYINEVTKHEYQDDVQILKQVIDLCQKLEDENLIKKFNLEEEISNIYRVLFRFFYEKGVIENNYKIDNNTIEKVFAFYFIPQVQEYLENIGKIVQIDSIDFNTQLLKQNDIKLIIEIEDYTLLEELQKKYKSLMSDIMIRIKSDTKALNHYYIYKPQNGFLLAESNLRQILLFIKNNPSIDFILLSFGLIDFPNIGVCKNLENNVIFKNNGISIKDLKSKNLHGKIIRLISEEYQSKSNIKDLLGQSIDEYGYWNKKKSGYIENEIITYQPQSYQKNKKLIFVFPIFLAVGGVERNTVEIIEALKEEYDFVVVNFERLNEDLGSLHHQFMKNCLGIYDLTELSTHDGILNYMKILNNYYKPDLIWICNGSPWMEHHLGELKMTFKNSAIVDQQVYDMNEGWVRLYKDKNPALLNFDRFIAINSKIKNVFEDEANIPEDKVDLIYSVMSHTKRVKALQSSRSELCEKYNLDVNQKYIVSIGRLTPQKAPLDLVLLIKGVVNKYGNEFKFIIVGSGELSRKLDQEIKKNRLENSIIRFDYLENTYELDLIAEAIIFTSLYEGLSIALLEALSVGTPGISTDVGDTKLIFDEFYNGLIFENIGNIDEYIEKFSHFMNNYEFYKKNAMINKDRIINKFSIETISKQYSESFKKALNAKGIQ